MQNEGGNLPRKQKPSKEPQDVVHKNVDDVSSNGAKETKGKPSNLPMRFRLMDSKPLDAQIAHLRKVISRVQPDDRPFMEKRFSDLWAAVESESGDEAAELKLRLKTEQERLLARYRLFEDPLFLLKEQLNTVRSVVFKNDREAIEEQIQQLQETLRNSDTTSSKARVDQPSVNSPNKEGVRGELLDGALSVLNKILASQAKKQTKLNVAKTSPGSDVQQATKKKKAQKATRTSSEGNATSVNVSYPPNDVLERDLADPTTEDTASSSISGRRLQSTQPYHTAPAFRDLGSKKARKAGLAPIKIEKVNPQYLHLTPVKGAQPQVPKLQYGLDRALFNPGVYHLQDPRSRVYNFDPYLASIMPIDQFDFNALKAYVTSSRDENLISMAAQHKKKYTGSTSSMTAMLSHFHYLLSSWRPINPAHTSRSFTPESFNFTNIMRAPAATFLHWKDGTYAIDADKEFDSANILSMLGRSMEKLLTLPKEDYEKYRLVNSDQLTETERNADESYHYTTMGDFMMRSQLDAYDDRLPGSGMFDLKTRAVVSIRMDAKDFHKGVGYEIRHRIGQWESYEREYYDMIRSAFLKYSLQVRMGRMDGIFVAFHNTRRIFGFQYISIDEMDLALHGTNNRILGDREFKISLKLLNTVLDRATARFPGRSLRLHVETRVGVMPFMYIFAKPVDAKEIHAVQTANKEAVEAFERNMLGLKSEDGQTDRVIEEDEDLKDEDEDLAEDRDDLNDWKNSEFVEQESEEVWQHMREVVEQTIENEARGLETIRDTIQEALTQSGLLQTISPEESRYYVDSLLEALNPRNASKQNTLDTSLPRDEEDVVDSSKSQEDVGDEDGSTTYDSTNRLTPDVEENVEAGEAAIMSSDSADQSITSMDNLNNRISGDTRPLKKLIASLAAKAETNSPQDSQHMTDDDAAHDVSPDQAKLRKFGNILSKMINKAKDSGLNTDEASPLESSEDDDASHATADLPGTAEQVESKSTTTASDEDLMGMILTVRNKVNGRDVQRPEDLSKSDSWTVSYHIEEIPAGRAETIYRQLKRRRQIALAPEKDRGEEWHRMFKGNLRYHSERGQRFRRKETEIAKTRPVHVYGHEKPLKYEEVFKEVEK